MISAVRMLTALLMISSMLRAQHASTDSTTPANRYGWTVRTFTADEIRQHPARELHALISLSSGFVVEKVEPIGMPFTVERPVDEAPGIYGRGSRNGDTEYRLMGLTMTDRTTNRYGLPFIPESIERVSVHEGAYGALLGAGSGGVVDLRFRRGGDSWAATAMHVTDDLAPTGSTFLGTSSFGQHTTVVTLGGPLPIGARLFVAGEIHRMRDRQPRWWDGFTHELSPSPLGGSAVSPPGPLTFATNHVPLMSTERTSLAWNLTASFGAADVSFWGSSVSRRDRLSTVYSSVREYYRQSRVPWWDDQRTVAGGSMELELPFSTILSASVAVETHRAHTSDPTFGEHWRLFADSTANAAAGYQGFTSRYSGPPVYGSGESLFFAHADAPNTSYARDHTDVFRSSVGVSIQMTPELHLAAQTEAEWWTLRRYAIRSIPGMRTLMDTNRDGIDDMVFADAAQELHDARRYGSFSGYGFDLLGRPVDGGPDGARKPSVVSISGAAQWLGQDFQLEIGGRHVWLNTDIPTPRRAPTPSGLWDQFPFDLATSSVADSLLEPAATISHFLPRLSLRSAVRDLEIRLAYGAYINMMPWDEILMDPMDVEMTLSPYRIPAWNQGSVIIPFAAKPDRTHHLEAGFGWRASQTIRWDLVIYRKTMTDLSQLGPVIVDTLELQPTGYVNSGSGSAAGGEALITVTPSKYVRLKLSYGYLDARGTSSSPRSNFGDIASGAPSIPWVTFPFDYEQRHRFIAELRGRADDEGVLGGLEAAVIGRWSSGHPYTAYALSSPGGSLFPWYSAMQWWVYPGTLAQVGATNDRRTPWKQTVDMTLSYSFKVGAVNVQVTSAISNVFNSRSIVNVFPTTGRATDDGWLATIGPIIATSQYYGEDFATLYRKLAQRNRWAMMSMTGLDTFDAPRQIRLGVEVSL